MRGVTVLELLVVLVIVGVVLAIAVPRARSTLDRVAVRSAAADVRAILSQARALALAAHANVAVDVDSARGELRVRRGVEVFSRRRLRDAHAVHLGGRRDSVRFDAYGIGRGATNLSIVLRRGAAAETVFVSRLGRIR